MLSFYVLHTYVLWNGICFVLTLYVCMHILLAMLNLNQAPHIGWRTEFRSMEVQLTDFENAAFTVFVALITRVVLAFDLAFYIPISKVGPNLLIALLYVFNKHG